MAELKLSVADWNFVQSEMEPQAYYAAIAAAGYVGAEMVGPDRREVARAAGLELVNVCAAGMDVGLNFTENHDALIPQIRETIQEAGADGIKQVIVFSGFRNGLDDATGIANCAGGLAQLVDDAETADVVLTFEMLCSPNHGDYHASASSFGYEVVRAVNSPRVRALYDIYHQARTGEDHYLTLVPNLNLVGHLHVAGSPNRDFPGPDQEIDYAPLVKAVQAAGYDGYWGMEFSATGNALAEALATAELFREYAA